MPLYDYKYPDGSFKEIRQKITDKALTKCPESGVPIKRVILSSDTGLKFKGSGFYTTDYKGK